MTLRSRLGVAAGLVIVVLLAVGVLLPRIVRASLIDEVDQQLSAALPAAPVLARGLGPPATVGGPSASTRLSELYVARVSSGTRQVFVAPASVSGREPKLPTRTFEVGTPPKPTTVGSVKGGGSWRAVLVRLPDRSSLVLALSLDRADATDRKLLLSVLIAGAVLVLAMLASGWWLIRLGLQPVAEVTAVADAIARGDRSRRVGEGVAGTEAAHLARAFNIMLDEQHATEERLRRFVADASHELRTPVAAIGGFADLWRQGAIDETQLADVMRRIGQESKRMRGLVEDLLLLARLDEGRPFERELVDLALLAADAALDASATHPSSSITVEAPAPVVVEGDDARLRQVVANLVTNALVHSAAPAMVTITVERKGDAAVLSVIDNGPGIAEEDAVHAFDRFWQADAARAGTGTGLGLAIVHSVVDAHGGQTRLDGKPGFGTTVWVVLPVASRPDAR
jgi:two-component system OmpR family sensor kinase